LSKKHGISELWNTEDWWAVWFGFIIILFAVWNPIGKAPKIGQWLSKPTDVFFSLERRIPLDTFPDDVSLKRKIVKSHLKYNAEKKILTYKGEMSDNLRIDLKGLSSDPVFKETIDKLYAAPAVRKGNIFANLTLLLAMLGVMTAAGVKFIGENPLRYILSMAAIFLLSILAYIFANHQIISVYGLSYAFWALIIGLIISNTIGTPNGF